MPRDELVKQLSPGEQTKDTVRKLIGTPSSIGTFDDRVWYYITQRTKNQAFFKPLLTDQKILALEFDEQEVLKSIKQYGIKEARLIEPHAEKTPTVGRKLTLIQQLFGNLGRFSSKDEQGATPGPYRPEIQLPVGTQNGKYNPSNYFPWHSARPALPITGWQQYS